MVTISGEKVPEKKDSNVNNKKTTNNAKEMGLVENLGEKVEEVQQFWSKWVDEAKFWLRWDDEETNTVIPGEKEQVWKETYQPGSSKSKSVI